MKNAPAKYDQCIFYSATLRSIRSLKSLEVLVFLCLTVEVNLFGSHLAYPGEVLLHFGIGHIGIYL